MRRGSGGSDEEKGTWILGYIEEIKETGENGESRCRKRKEEENEGGRKYM